jgi:hypothetical protein
MTLLVLLMIAAAEPQPLALVTAYQSVGAEPSLVSGLTTRLRSAASENGLALIEQSDAARLQRAAVMCGEDITCLSTLGARAKARWVIGFGVARVGASMLFSALLIDVPKGVRVSMFSKSIPAKELDEVELIRAATTELFRDVDLVPVVPPPVVLVPVPVTPKPAWVPEVRAPAPSHRLRPAAWAATGLTLALVIATVAVSAAAKSHHGTLAATPVDLRPAADGQQRTLNLGADVLLGSTLALGTTSGILWILDGRLQ